MKIAHVITTLESGGAENQLLQLVTQQSIKKWTIEVYPLKGNLDLQEEMLRLGVKINKRLYKKNLFSQVLLIKFMSYKSYDIVHCHLPLAELLISLSRAKRVIVSRHYGGAFYPGSTLILSKCLSRFATRKVKTVVACSKFVKKHLENSGEIRKSVTIKVVYYGFVPNYTYKKQPRSITFTEPNKLILGTLARLSPEKDIKTLISAISLLPQDVKQRTRVNIFGDGNQKDELLVLINKLNLFSIVRLCGKTSSPIQAIDSMDVFILTSKFEGFGMVLLESMSLGKPIICSRIETAQEVLGKSGCAIYFEPGNSVDLAEKIMNYGKLLNKNYVNLQAKRLKIFTPQIMSQKIADAYQEMLRR